MEDEGGFYPGKRGDRLCSKTTVYQVVRKLGFGQVSNVWLANNTSATTGTCQYHCC